MLLSILNHGDRTGTSLVRTNTVLEHGELVVLRLTTLDGLTLEGIPHFLEGGFGKHLFLELAKRLTLGIPASEGADRQPGLFTVTDHADIISERRIGGVVDLLRDHERIFVRELNDITLMHSEGTAIDTDFVKFVTINLRDGTILRLTRQQRHLIKF